ncbi:MAG: GNAT family N-acetyltransferase [Alphaproteobacteria bacterium]|nr:GNAT family N-acetyltransferase [Alphaproteobacteria bacterium]
MMIIRRAKEADIDGVHKCAVDAYQQYVSVIGRKPAPMTADFKSQIEQGIIHIKTDENNEVDGFIIFYPINNYMFLENIAIRSSATGKGIGKTLIQLCENEAKKLGLTAIQLYTNEKMTDNLSIYSHLGYRETERRKEDGFNRVYFEKIL